MRTGPPSIFKFNSVVGRYLSGTCGLSAKWSYPNISKLRLEEMRNWLEQNSSSKIIIITLIDWGCFYYSKT